MSSFRNLREEPSYGQSVEHPRDDSSLLVYLQKFNYWMKILFMVGSLASIREEPKQEYEDPFENCCDCEPPINMCSTEDNCSKKAIDYRKSLPETYWDKHAKEYVHTICTDGKCPEYEKIVPNLRKRVEYSIRKGKKQQHIVKTYPVKIKFTQGQPYYWIDEGENRSSIIDILSQVRISDNNQKIYDFSYLREQTKRCESLNYPDGKIPANHWAPIPFESGNRELSDEHYAAYFFEALEAMKENKIYREQLKQVLEIITIEELVATMIAIGKKESGGRPMGQCEFYRYEAEKKVYSFSIFHIIMDKTADKKGDGWGLAARKNLNLTEGQTYHPWNAAQLFLAFIIEKSSKKKIPLRNLFPIQNHWEYFAEFYNGTEHASNHYVPELSLYLQKAYALLKDKFTCTLNPDHVKVIQPDYVRVGKGKNALLAAILQSNARNAPFFDKEHSILLTKKNAELLADYIVRELRKIDKNAAIFEDDSVFVGVDKDGRRYVKFKTGKIGEKFRKKPAGTEIKVYLE